MTADGRPAPVRWGILGTGAIARSFTQDLMLDGHEVVAVGARRQESADDFGGRFGIPRRHASYDSLLADEDVDVVYVATLNPLHEEHAVRALSAGKHVLLEKPFAMNALSAEAIFRCADEHGVIVMEAMWSRYLPHLQKLHMLLADGAIGEVRAVSIDISQSLSTDPTNRLNDPTAGGGALYDLGPYALSLMTDIVGEPKEITVAARPAASGVDAQFSLLACSNAGAQGLISVAIDLPGRLDCSVVGTRGRIDIAPAWHRPSELILTTDDRTHRYSPPVVGRGMQYEARALERLLATDDGPAADARALTLSVMRTLDAVRTQLP